MNGHIQHNGMIGSYNLLGALPQKGTQIDSIVVEWHSRVSSTQKSLSLNLLKRKLKKRQYLFHAIRKHTEIFLKKNLMQAVLNVLHREIASLIPRLLSKSYQEREYPSCFTRFKVPRIDNGYTRCPDQTHKRSFKTHEIGVSNLVQSTSMYRQIAKKKFKSPLEGD